MIAAFDRRILAWPMMVGLVASLSTGWTQERASEESGLPDTESADGMVQMRGAGPSFASDVEPDRFRILLERSPFLRTLNLADTYSLRAVANVGPTPMATLFNKDTGQTVTVSADEANEFGMKVIEVNQADALEDVSIKVSMGGEVVAIKYDTSRLTPSGSGGAGGDGKRGDGRSDDQRKRGPSKEDLQRYNALPKEKKERLHAYIRQTQQKYPNMSREERGNLIRGALMRLVDGREIDMDQGPPSSSGGGNR